MSKTERTFILIKPDGVQRGLVGEIIGRFERKGLKIVAIKSAIPTAEILKKHYAAHVDKGFYPGLETYMKSGPAVALVFEGLGAVAVGRALIGLTDPLSSAPGTIRGDLGLQVGRNLVHGSDSVESACTEIALWFNQKDLLSWTPTLNPWIYE